MGTKIIDVKEVTEELIDKGICPAKCNCQGSLCMVDTSGIRCLTCGKYI